MRQMVCTALLLLSLGTALGLPTAPHTDPPYGPPGQFLSRVRPAIGSTLFDVTKYGARGDKVTDDTKPIQMALDACVKSPTGGVVLLPNKVSSTSTAVGSKEDRAQQCGPTSEGNYPGTNLGGHSSVPSADACCAICGTTSGCSCWDWKSSTKECYTKKDCGSLQEEKGRVTGKMGPPTPAPPTPTLPPGPGVPRGAHSEPVIPPEDGSVYLSYPLVLDHATGCAIVIEPRVTLLQKPWSGKKPPTDRYKGAFLGIDNSVNIAIGGGGTIRGNGQTWWFGPGGVTWPELIRVEATKNVALWNFTAMDSAFHHLEMFAGNFEISHVQVLIDWTHPKPADKEYAPCTDGIDVHGTPAYIHNTVIDVGDDNIAVHASNVVVEDSHFGGPKVCEYCVHGHGATIGSMDSHDKVDNVVFRNIVMERTNEGPRIKVRCTATGGHVQDITYENMVLKNLHSKNFNIFTNYDCKKEVDEGVASKLPVGWETIRRPWSNYTLHRSPDGVIYHTLENALSAAIAVAAPAAASGTSPNATTLGESSDDAYVVSNLVFSNITATGTHEQGGFSCTDDIKCQDITMSGIHTDKGGMQCHSATGKATDNSPPISCL